MELTRCKSRRTRKKFHHTQQRKTHYRICAGRGAFSVPKFAPVSGKLTRSQQYNHPNWKALTRQIRRRDGNQCRKCVGDIKRGYIRKQRSPILHVHHKRYLKGRFIWHTPPEYLITLCQRCHEWIHS